MCIFDRKLVPGANPPAVTQRRYYKPWSVASQPSAPGAVAVDVNRPLNVVNPAYVTVISKLRRDAPVPMSGVEGERSLHAAVCAGALKAVVNGLLAPTPDGFLATTWVGAIPAVLAKVVAGLGEIIDPIRGFGVLPLDAMSKYRAARYLWARPRDCEYSEKEEEEEEMRRKKQRSFLRFVDQQAATTR